MYYFAVGRLSAAATAAAAWFLRSSHARPSQAKPAKELRF